MSVFKSFRIERPVRIQKVLFQDKKKTNQAFIYFVNQKFFSSYFQNTADINF